MGGQQFCADAVMIDIRKLNRVLSFDRERGLLEVESGIQWPEILAFLHTSQQGSEKPWAFAQKQTGADRLTIGGCLSANIHGRGLSLPPFINDVESFKLVDRARQPHAMQPRGEPRALPARDRRLRPLRLHLLRHPAPRAAAQARSAWSRCAISPGSPAPSRSASARATPTATSSTRSTRSPRTSCGAACSARYRPVEDDRPMPSLQRELGEGEWTELLFLAHTNKSEAFRRYARYYLSTNGQVYWSDEHQMAYYPDDYHRSIDRMTDAPNKGERGDHRDLLRARRARALHGATCATTRAARASTSSTAPSA